MDLLEGIKTRRSIRKFKNEPIKREIIAEIIQSAIYAPSWKNTQVTRYIAIDKRNTIDELAKECMGEHNTSILKTSQLLIIATAITGISGFERDGTPTTDRGDGWQMFDCGVSCQTFSLAAHEKNIGTVILGVFDREKLEEYLNLEDDREVIALIACGYYEELPVPPKKKTVEDILSFRD